MRGAQPRHSLGPGSESLHRRPDMGLSTHEATNLRAWAQGRTEGGLGQCSVSPAQIHLFGGNSIIRENISVPLSNTAPAPSGNPLATQKPNWLCTPQVPLCLIH